MFCCSRYRPREPEYAPLVYRNRRIRRLKYKLDPNKKRRFMCRKWNGVSLRLGLLSFPKRKSKFRPKIPKSPRFAYQIRHGVAVYKKWHDDFVMSIVGVQPMTAPTGLIFTLKYRYHYDSFLERWEDDGGPCLRN